MILHSDNAHDLQYECKTAVLAQTKEFLEEYLKISTELLDLLVIQAIISEDEKKLILRDVTDVGKVKRMLLYMDDRDGDLAVKILVDYLERSPNRMDNEIGKILVDILTNTQ